DRLLALPAENCFGLRIPLADDTALIPLHEGIERGVDDAARHALALDQRLLGLAPLGEIARYLGIAEDLATIAAHGVDHHIRPEARAAFAHAPALGLITPVAPGRFQHALGHAGSTVFWRVEDREMLADDLVAGIALD